MDEKEIVHSAKDDIKDLYKKVAQSYNLEPNKQSNERFTRLCSGYISIVDGIATIRNKYGDAHGKSVTSENELEQYHVDFVINITGSLVTFLLSLTNRTSREDS